VSTTTDIVTAQGRAGEVDLPGALFRICTALLSELDVQKVVQRLTDEATALCRAQFGAFFYNLIGDDGEQYTLYTLAGVPRERFAGFPMPRNTQVFGPTFRGEGVVRLDDVTRDARYGNNAPYHGMPDGHLPVRSYLALPVRSRSGEVLGGLFFGHSEPGVFTQSDEDILVVIAAQAAVGIENARLFESERRARAASEQSQRRTARLHAITAQLSRALGAEEITRVVVEEVRSMFDAPAASVILLDSTGTKIEHCVFGGQIHAHSRELAAIIHLDLDLPPCEAARTGEVVWVMGEANLDARYPHLHAVRLETGAKTWGALPIQFEGKILGAVGVRLVEERPMTDDERAFMVALSRQCGQALERARLHDGLQAAKLEAEHASRAKDEFLAMLGHELRNPLSPILTAVQLMKMRGETSAAREHAIIERQVGHLIHLVDDLLDISRITRGKVELEKKPVKLASIVSKAIETASPLLEDRRHHLEVALPADEIWIEGDEIRLCQVITNLLTNAVKYTHLGGHIRIGARCEGGEAVISIRDNGIGIGPELLPHVFDLFVQGMRTSDRAAGGLGLGLALVRTLIGMHGGRVAAASDGPERGSEFTVHLPTLALSAIVPSEVERPPRARLQVTARRVLVVDDNQDAAALLGQMLESVGHQVLVANDGPGAIEALANFHPEIAILDIGLPVMDGYELAGVLRERLGRNVRLMAVTGYGQEQDRARAELAGFDAHFVKPVGLNPLLTAIEAQGDTIDVAR
jgi:signal transduction histidine kinase/ActR/RegA family two-component response regulator